MSVKLSSRQVGDVTVMDVAGRITLGEGSSALRDALRELVGKNQKKILLNLGDVSYIDSDAIAKFKHDISEFMAGALPKTAIP